MAKPYFRINVPSDSWFKLKVTGTGNFRASAHFQREGDSDDFWSQQELAQGKRRKLKAGNHGGHINVKFPGTGTAIIEMSIKKPDGTFTQNDPYAQQVDSNGPSPNMTSIAISAV